MSHYLKILGSSSSGNCALLSTPESKILIDAGFSAKKIVNMLEDAGESIDAVDAVLLTHEHGDHSAGMPGLSKYTDLNFFANRDTAESIQHKLKRKANWTLFENGRSFQFKDLKISPFSIPHDAYDPVGFIIEMGDGSLFAPYRSLAWVTDLGYIPNMVREKIRNVDLLVLESNYDLEMLENDTKRPWSVKQRIQGRHGHLSNQAAFEYIVETEKPRWTQVCLAHLSRDCNSVELVKKVFAPILQNSCNYKVDILDPESGTAFAYNLGAFA